MDAHIVEKAPMPPGQCLFSQDIDGPWIDTGLVAPWIRPYGYLGVTYVESLARELLDMVSRSEVEKLSEALEAQAEEIESLKKTLDSMEQLQSVLQPERMPA